MSERLADPGVDPRTQATLGELVKAATEKVSALARKEVELAKLELKADLKTELATARSLGIAALLALLGLNGLVVAAILGLGHALPDWLAALIIAAALFLVAAALGLWGWTRRVKRPLATTRRSLEDNVAWAKRRLA